MARCRRSRAAALLLALGAWGCAALEPGPPVAGDRWERCTEAVARGALQQANALIVAGDNAAALRWLRQALAMCPDHMPTHLLHLDTARKAGGEALPELREFYESRLAGASPIAPFMLAEIEEYEATRQRHLQESLARDPSFYYAYLELARQQRRLDRPQRALVFLRDALRSRPSFAPARLALGEVLVDLGRFEEAEPEFANYRRAHPEDRKAAKAHARLLIYDLDRPRVGRPIVAALLAADPDDADLLMDLAAVAWKEGEGETALELYHRVLLADTAQTHAVLNIGNLYFEVLARGSEAARRAAWAKARNAYRYYLGMGHAADVHDLWDSYLTVPYRLKQIDELLGPAPPGPIALSDF
jgi:thioredoxin-like negative regulator of GroEL